MDRLCALRCIRYEMLKRDIPTGKFSPFSPEKTASYKSVFSPTAFSCKSTLYILCPYNLETEPSVLPPEPLVLHVEPLPLQVEPLVLQADFPKLGAKC